MLIPQEFTRSLALFLVGCLALATIFVGSPPAQADIVKTFICAIGGCQPFAAAPDCSKIGQVLAGGTTARHTFSFQVICDGKPIVNVEGVYDYGSGRASEQISGANGTLKSTRNCADDPWIFSSSRPACGRGKVQRAGNLNGLGDVEAMTYPLSASILTSPSRNVLAAQLQNALNASAGSGALGQSGGQAGQSGGEVIKAQPRVKLFADLAVAGMDGPNALQAGLSGTYVATIRNDGTVAAPLEIHVVFAGKIDQTGQIVAGAGLACEVVHDAGINAAVRCVGGRLEAGATTTVVVQGRGQVQGNGMMVVNLNASRSVKEPNYDNNFRQFNVSIN